MIFHPLVWRGIPLRVIDGQPLGLFGWQGIVPAKAGVMAERMVDMVTTQLVDVEQVRYIIVRHLFLGERKSDVQKRNTPCQGTTCWVFV